MLVVRHHWFAKARAPRPASAEIATCGVESRRATAGQRGRFSLFSIAETGLLYDSGCGGIDFTSLLGLASVEF